MSTKRAKELLANGTPIYAVCQGKKYRIIGIGHKFTRTISGTTLFTVYCEWSRN
jgi:hypothetical protein